jgi:signal transduction histidine kinase
LYSLLAGLIGIGLVAFVLYRSNRQKAKANDLLQQKKEQLQLTVNELKATQAQLIQSEKMASLGELTAGIAHEIQNPLNFVNNFSETNIELIDEMQQEIDKGNLVEVKVLATDVKKNEQKIVHHGKRADTIVKNMLQHARPTSVGKEQVDLNAMVDECLRLSYHGYRAKEKSFNAKLETQLSPQLERVNAVPQDISRVLINLFNNALYSVTEKKKQLNGEFEPTVLVSTKQNNGKAEVIVKDNGLGIPASVIDKIYQPFFTTKPTGEGTGLGLSLSYDIVKAHGGEMKVKTKEGEFAEFIIQLPLR